MRRALGQLGTYQIVDILVRLPWSASPVLLDLTLVEMSARTNMSLGTAAALQTAAQRKWSRYQGAVVPLAFTTAGRMSTSTEAMLRALAGWGAELGHEPPSRLLRRWRHRLELARAATRNECRMRSVGAATACTLAGWPKLRAQTEGNL